MADGDAEGLIYGNFAASLPLVPVPRDPLIANSPGEVSQEVRHTTLWSRWQRASMASSWPRGTPVPGPPTRHWVLLPRCSRMEGDVVWRCDDVKVRVNL